MNLPKSVQAQADKAQELFDGQEDVVEVAPKIEVDPNLLEKKEDDVPVVDINNLGGDVNEPAKIIKKAPEKDENEEVLKNLEAMNKKYINENKTLMIRQGQHDRVVSDLNREISSLKTEVEGLKADLIKKETPAPAPNTISAEDRQLLVDEGLGDDVIAIFEKMGVQPAAVVDNSRVEKLENEIASVRAETTQEKIDKFWNRLDTAVPEWDAIDKSPEFNQYLQQMPKYSDRTLLEIIKDAQSKFDVDKVIEIFNDYTAGTKSLETPNEIDDLTKDLNLDNGKPKLKDIATPKSTQGKPPEAKPGKWTPTQTTNFYNFIAKNPTKYTPEEILKIEKAHIYPN